MPDARENQAQRRRVCAELWTSFTALIRSYVAAHDLARPAIEHAQVEESGAGRLTLRSGHKTLALTFGAAQGAGSWTLYEDDSDPERALEQGSFEIDNNSRVALSDRAGKLELEVAAEAFTAKIFEE